MTTNTAYKFQKLGLLNGFEDLSMSFAIRNVTPNRIILTTTIIEMIVNMLIISFFILINADFIKAFPFCVFYNLVF
jgi:hypothetical protein